MAINFGKSPVTGMDDKELLLVSEGYVARPVTVSKDTVAGLTPVDGHYIIPQGTYLYGKEGSLLVNPQQEAVAVNETVTKSTLTVNSSVIVTAKAEGDLSAYTVAFEKGTKRTLSVNFDVKTTALVVTLAVDKTGAITTTYKEVVDAINDDIVANTFVKAELASGVGEDAVAAEAVAAPLSKGGDATVDKDIDGILYHSVDVTDGEATGALIIHGYVNVDNMPSVPSAAVKAKLPHIVFGRKD